VNLPDEPGRSDSICPQCGESLIPDHLVHVHNVRGSVELGPPLSATHMQPSGHHRLRYAVDAELELVDGDSWAICGAADHAQLVMVWRDGRVIAAWGEKPPPSVSNAN
jgi:hypothetical protein